MPDGFLRRVGNMYELNSASALRQQPLREMLAPLFPLLRQLIWERKHLAERLFLQAQQRAEEGGVPIPYEYTDSVPSLVKKQGGEWELAPRELTLRFMLWTKRSWILNHHDRYSESMLRDADGYNSFSPERDWGFVQFNGDASTLLWFGDLVEAQLLRRLKPDSRDLEDVKRLRLSRELGFTYGCSANPSGLLNPCSPWLTEHMREEDLILEPESLYRGVITSC
jgi:hypothetical protein